MIDVRDVQEEKAHFPIEVTLLGIVIDVIDEQEENAAYPIEVTLYSVELKVTFSGMVMVVTP